MTLPLPWTLSKDDPAGPDLEDRVQEMFDELAQQFPVGIQNTSQVPQARVYNSAALVIPNNAATALTFDSERWDTAGLHSIAANTSRLTCVTAGLHIISGVIEWAANAVGYRTISVKLNGATFIANDTIPTVAGGIVTQRSISTSYRLVAGDYLELVVVQTSGGNLNVNATANYSPEFSMHWVSP